MFICIEGPDGSGKTSQSKALAEWMGAEWRCFPDRRTPIGKLIDWHLKGEWRASSPGSSLPMSDGLLDALMFQALQLANRAEVMPDILTALRSGKTVVCDRYWGSGFAYGAADGIDKDYLVQIHRMLPEPALNILIDVDVDTAISRMASRGAAKERYEGNREFMKTVADNYRDLWARKKGDPCWVVVDGTGTAPETLSALKRLVDSRRRG